MEVARLAQTPRAPPHLNWQGGPFSLHQKQYLSAYDRIKFKLIMIMEISLCFLAPACVNVNDVQISDTVRRPLKEVFLASKIVILDYFSRELPF